MADLKLLIGKCAGGQSLTREEARTAFDVLMSGEATPSQIGGLLMALRVRGETVDEITGAVEIMREKMLRVEAPPEAIDIVGTGGESLMPLSVCDTASRKVCPACSGTSESTSIDKPAMAIRTRFSASVLSTVALTSVPDCKTNPGAAAPGVVAITGSVGVTVMAMSQGLGFKP